MIQKKLDEKMMFQNKLTLGFKSAMLSLILIYLHFTKNKDKLQAGYLRY